MPPGLAEGLEVTCQIEDLAVGLGMTTFISPVRIVDGQHEVRCRAAGMGCRGCAALAQFEDNCVCWQAGGVQQQELLAQALDICTGSCGQRALQH